MSEIRHSVGAPGKLNLGLFVGAPRGDGLHPLVSVFEPVSLADRLDIRYSPGAGRDTVICPGLTGDEPNIAERALELCRKRGLLEGWDVELTIDKLVPVAAGMGGGSGDAAALLRSIAQHEALHIRDFAKLAFKLGADVPSQLIPTRALVTGAGEGVESLGSAGGDDEADYRGHYYVIVPDREGLSTAAIFHRADELGNWHELEQAEARLRSALAAGSSIDALTAIAENGLEPAILALRPELAAKLDDLRAAGARWAAFTGSGPTAFGVFADGPSATAAVTALAANHPGAVAARPAAVTDWRVLGGSEPAA